MHERVFSRVIVQPTPLKLNSLYLSFVLRQIMLCLAVGFVLTICFGAGVKCLSYTSATDSTKRDYAVLAVGLWHKTASFWPAWHHCLISYLTMAILPKRCT